MAANGVGARAAPTAHRDDVELTLQPDAGAERARAGGGRDPHLVRHVDLARPRAGRARRPAPRPEGQRAELDGPGRLARRGRHPRRGDPAGAAARPRVPPARSTAARRSSGERRHPGLGRPRAGGGRAARRPRAGTSRSPAARRRGRPTSAPRRCARTGPAWTSGSRTSAACRPTTSTRTSAWPTARCSRGSRARPSTACAASSGRRTGRPPTRTSSASSAPSALDLILVGVGPGRAHLLAVPRRRRPRRARAAGGGGRDARNGAAGVADHAYASGGERERARSSSW